MGGTFTLSTAPEPASLALVTICGLGVAFMRRRKA
jgi:hypothetical protein